MKTEKYIVNGKILNSYEEVEKYCEDKNFRIRNTTTMTTRKGLRHVVDVTDVNAEIENLYQSNYLN